jgi:hypothetical protein
MEEAVRVDRLSRSVGGSSEIQRMIIARMS